ncbi:alpha/beta hydrolase [Mycolicibacterium arenosum]|uniref:Alpha/beta hydrolase n=1 Tax=Mycolicibacterium arenosum TaxID=2952157 RepID=A0ABT1MC14_9MYCO|nr:alpha/beta hydrolase [Mycolicibacterium sp. CAU 1645]MCP9276397.1 alpha/beta hydrolase [Mycolicibacterium sp. CAU 1645]
MNLTRGVLAAASVVSLVAGCSTQIDGRAVMGTPPPGTPVAWTECPPMTVTVATPPGAQCGMLSVPVDYSKPDGDVAQIAMIKIPATGQKIGSLVVNPGGPGKSGNEAAAGIVGLLPPSVREKFDLVGFDPRGVAGSRPDVWCNSDADNDRERAEPQVDYSETGVAGIEQDTKDFVQRCVDKMGDEYLANLGTINVARDLDAIREALGDDKLTYLGYSYGTRIGAFYAEQFPDRIRAMILDGAIDPNADPAEADIRQAAAFQTAFNDYAADCAKDPTCPLGTDPAKAVEVYKGLVEPLVETPAETDDPRGLSYNDAVIGTILALYSPAMWQNLTAGLQEVRAGRGDNLLRLADYYMGRDAQGRYDNSTDVRVAVNCVDKPPITDRAKVIDQDRRAREAAPFMNYGDFTGYAPLGTCAFWPVPPTSEPHELEVDGLPPTLVVSTTNDPATPYQAGVELAEQLGGALLTFDGTQHTVVFQGDSCVDDIASKYLIDLVTPPQPATC